MRRRHTPPHSAQRQEPPDAAAGEAPAIDFPKEGETVAPAHYTLRISSPRKAQAVEVRIGQGPWLPCRHGSGFWWCDWSDIEPGSYQARARVRFADGRMMLTLLRRFQAGV
ncbi:MAG: hypothetical protein NTY77_20805 [Elusimicrobia bacterium]|nr:hypothetical protein [Elusimicrobiota bacterium]